MQVIYLEFFASYYAMNLMKINKIIFFIKFKLKNFMFEKFNIFNLHLIIVFKLN
jgi:hypothetical protein